MASMVTCAAAAVAPAAAARVRAREFSARAVGPMRSGDRRIGSVSLGAGAQRGMLSAVGTRQVALVATRASGEGEVETAEATTKEVDVDKEMSKQARKIATTFAPRSSTAKKNPAFKGSALYTIFEVQAYLSLVAGALLSYNVVLPSDEPNIARLMGMWSVWMFTVPSLRARECDAKEKDALNFLFIAIPLINVLIPVVWKSFAAVFTADCLLMAYMYYNKGAGIFDDGAEAPPKADDAA